MVKKLKRSMAELFGTDAQSSVSIPRALHKIAERVLKQGNDFEIYQELEVKDGANFFSWLHSVASIRFVFSDVLKTVLEGQITAEQVGCFEKIDDMIHQMYTKTKIEDSYEPNFSIVLFAIQGLLENVGLSGMRLLGFGKTRNIFGELCPGTRF